MPVLVYGTRNEVAAQFDDGQKILEDDGHLRVSDGSRTIALYAPGSWHHAEVILAASAAA
jgi:hypothetical protein